MRLWRASRHPALDGAGGLLVAGRWHSLGRGATYCAESVPGVVLELRVHLEVEPEDIPTDYWLIALDLPHDFGVETIDPGILVADWQRKPGATQALGDAWLASRRTPALRVPSAIAPHTWNVLLNPEHAACGSLAVADRQPLILDPRLIA